MNLYNIFEGLKDPKDNPCWKGYRPVGTKEKNGKTVPNCVPNEGVEEQAPATDTVADEKQKQYANDTAAIAQGELANKMPRMMPTDREDPEMGMQEQDEYGNPVTEHNEVIDEVAMNPRAFAQAIKAGQTKGVLVGFEFETCIPKSSVDTWKNGPQQTAGGYNPADLSWIEGKTAADVIDGLNRVGRKNWGDNLNDLFKYKASVKTATGYKSPWYHYTGWVSEKIAAIRDSADADQLVFKALAAFLKDPEVKAMEVSYMNERAVAEFGPDTQYNGRTFALAVLKKDTGVDFSKRVAKAALTPELARAVREACRKMYQWTRGPFDTRVHQISNAADNYVSQIENQYLPGRSYRYEVNDESVAGFKQHFAEFCREKMGTDNLKELLKTKWAFNGRVNNTSDTLREKLWYYVTPGAAEPQSLQARSYRSTDYMEGAQFLKANLKDVFGENMVIFRGYHQEAKKLDRWYIEPDGSLRPNTNDYSAEVVSPPLPAADAMTALRTWYSKAEQLKLYTNNSTGLHINVSIPDTLDVLKLATFVGDQHVLKMFGRENNNYARSVIKSLKGNSSLPKVGSSEFKDAEAEMKNLVKSISGDHFATVNFNGKYVSFRHAGGDYLSKGKDIADTVGRFVRAMIIAADPQAYRDEYVSKLVKMMKSPTQNVNDKLPLSDIRSIASKGIPTVNLDVVVMPETSDMPGQSDIDNSIAAIKRWAGEDWKAAPHIVPDPGARARMLDSRGFASSTKQWMERAPENMFYRVTIYPTNRRELESLTDSYTAYGTERGAAIGLHYGGKKAVGVKYRELIKQDNPAFVSAVQALRGGSSKPLPLPGSKAAPATQAPAAQQSAEKFGIWNSRNDHWVENGNGRIEGTREQVQDYMNQHNLTNSDVYVMEPLPDSAQQAPSQEGIYGIYDGASDRWYRENGEVVTFPRRSDADDYITRNRLDPAIHDSQLLPLSRSRQQQTSGYSVVDADGRTIGQSHATEDDALEAAQYLANARGATYFVNDSEGNRVGGAHPVEDDDDSTTYNYVDLDSGERLATEEYASNAEAMENAQELANNENISVAVYSGQFEIGRVSPEDEQDITTGSYDLVTQLGDRVAGYVGSLQDAMDAAQHHANQNRQTVWVLLNGQRLGGRSPIPQQDDQSLANYAVVSISGRVMARGDSLRDIRIAAQGWADRERTTMEIRGTDDNRVIDTIEPREQANESRIYHASGKVNVIYNPHNSNKQVMVARAVDHAMANRVISTYVHNTNSDPTKQPLSDKDFVLQPLTYEDFASPGGSTTNDSTSPIHGFGEEQEADYSDEYQAMVQRVGQKAREQEKRQPVDLAALAQRLRQGEEEVDEHIVKVGDKYRLVSKHGNKNLGTYDTKAGAEKRERQVQYFKHMGEDEIVESRLYAMKRAGYDIL